MAYRNKLYVALDYDSDKNHYNLLRAWNNHDALGFSFHDAHDLNSLRSTSSEDQIKRKLMVRLNNSKMFLLLLGENTKNLYKYVRWEIEKAIDLDLPIVVANLNQRPGFQALLIPPILRNALCYSVPFRMAEIKLALEEWPQKHAAKARLGLRCPVEQYPLRYPI